MHRLGSVLALLLCACRSSGSAPAAPAEAPSPEAAPSQAAPAPPPAGSARPPHAPLSQDELATTDGSIAVGNLHAAIEGAERILKERPQDPMVLERLVLLLCTRGQYLGRIADYERAAEVAERMVRTLPREPRGYLVRARVRSTFHRFAEAGADLDRAARLGEQAERMDGLRVGLLAATGRTDEALALQERLSRQSPDIMNLGSEAALRGERGETERAEELFIRAQQAFKDTSPLPLAWLYLQHGLMWEAADRVGRARELFLAARDRVPAYAAATSHLASALAATGDRAQAIALLRALARDSDDPEYAGQLAGLLREAGQVEEAERLRGEARARYEALLKRHPEAYAAHAARFFLGPGADPARALALAQRNLTLLPRSVEAHTLAIEASTAAGPPQRACALVDAALKLPRPTPRLRVVAARALTLCGQGDRAAALLRPAQ